MIVCYLALLVTGCEITWPLPTAHPADVPWRKYAVRAGIV